MIKKRETCLYCGEKMESVTAKKKFCCPLHRVYWNREFKNAFKGEPIKSLTLEVASKPIILNELKTINNSARISELEAELKTVPENTTLGKRRIAYLKKEIYRLKSNPPI